MTDPIPSEDIADFFYSMSESPNYSQLARLSGLSSKELDQFKMAWISLPRESRREILGRLIELGEENLELSFFEVFQSCLSDDDKDVRTKATIGLWECDDRVIIRPLIHLLHHDPSDTVRAASATTLGKFATLAQSGKLYFRDRDRLRDSLLGAINREGQDSRVICRSIEAVASLGGTDVDIAIDRAYETGDLEFKQSALFAMGQSSEVKWLPKILHEFIHTNPAIRYEAVTACGLLGDDTTVSNLINLTQDEDTQVQLAAISALGEIGGPLAKQSLLNSIENSNKTVGEAAKGAMANLEFDEDPMGLNLKQ